MNNLSGANLFRGEWLESIPQHWEQKKIKHLFKIEKRLAGKLGHKVISITQRGAKLKDTEFGGGQLSMDYSKYQLVNPGDFLMNHMDLLTGYVDISKYKGVTSPDYRVFISLDKGSHPPFFLYVFQNCYKSKIFYAYGRGSSHLGRWRFSTVEFKGFYFPVPPIEEQKLISRYLDKKTEQIDRLIVKIQKKIELLKEQRTALINQCVTKGLDLNVEMKDSGIEWIGDIPKHWEIRRLRYLCDITTGGKNTEDSIKNGKYPLFVRSPKIERIDTWSFDGEAVLTSGDGAGVGKIFHHFDGKFDFHQRVYKFSNFQEIIGHYFFWFLKENFQYEILRWNAKSTVDSVRLPFLQNFPMLLPPIDEQNLLLEKINNFSQKTDVAIDRFKMKIKLLKEYRQSLISSAVTGKFRITEEMI